MKTIEQLIEERSVALPFKENDMEVAYRLGQLNSILELIEAVRGYPVNGIVKGIVTEDQLNQKLVELMNG